MSNLVTQRLSQEIQIENALEQYWDETLTPSVENEHPLADSGEVRAGRVDETRYRRQNMRLTFKSWRLMAFELEHLSQTESFKSGKRRTIVILGWGLGRDTTWIITATAIGFRVVVLDASNVAIANCEAFVELHKLADVSILKVEVEEAWTRGLVDETTVLAYYASQFIQNQDEDQMVRMMKHFGRFLKDTNDVGLYLFHPLGEDNPRNVGWRNSIPYHLAELKAPLGYELGQSANVEELGRHRHYTQKYTYLKISAP